MEHAWKYTLGSGVETCPKSALNDLIQKHFLRRRLLIAEPGAQYLRAPTEIPECIESCISVFAKRLRLIAWLAGSVGFLYGTAALLQLFIHSRFDFYDLALSVMALLGCALTVYSIRLANRRASEFVDQLRLTTMMQGVSWKDVFGTLCVSVAICLIWGACMLIASTLQLSFDDLLEAFALMPQKVQSGEYYRLVSGVLMHANFQHLMLNVIGMCVFGGLVEMLYRSKTFWLVVVSSALVGAIGTTFLNNHAGSVGISGGIFGLAFFLIAASFRLEKAVPLLTRLSIFVAMMLSLAISCVYRAKFDVYAHGFGALMGLLLGLAYAHVGTRLSNQDSAVSLGSVMMELT